MKDECNFDPIIQFTALAPKLYSFTTRNHHDKKVGKGINRAVLRDDIKHKDYNDILNSGDKKSCKMVNLRSKNHTIMTVRSEKKCLTSFDNKMHRIDKNTAFPFGFHTLNQTRDS